MQGKGGAPGAVQKSGSGDRDPFTQMEEDHHRREKEFMAKQREMDKLFDDKVADRNKRFAERAARLDARDADLKKAIEERKTEIDRMMNEVGRLVDGAPCLARKLAVVSSQRKWRSQTVSSGRRETRQSEEVRTRNLHQKLVIDDDL
ncbi:hypothetical protein PRIPAC_86972 [Pristionchus pacificus]|nr:hypothetical protein PRIPAC_86972 [Pristionchus pacificus]